MEDLNQFGLTLKNRAHWTHNIIHRSVILGLGIMEETLTDMHLFSIADEYNTNIITKKFTRREEGTKSGADWLWIIGEPGSWLPLLIQAKVINPKTGNCQHFDYKDGCQRKQLLSYARQHAYVPLYCIYSCIPSGFTPPSFFDDMGLQKEDWACSFISPKTVRILSKQGIKNQIEILKYGIPWMVPFHLTPSDKYPAGQSIADTIMQLRDKFEKTDTKRLTSGTQIEEIKAIKGRIYWENLDTSKSIKTEIPKAICKMFNSSFSNLAQSPLATVSIISTVPIDQIKELNEAINEKNKEHF